MADIIQFAPTKPTVKFIIIEGINDYDMTTPEWAVHALDGAWLATCDSYDTASLLCDALRDKRGF
jgi:hypothetical protein